MASHRAGFAYPQNKGTLLPGQTISVNKHVVLVERYLSQGGFAHVYLVRTPAPVYGTTHHVLKRIAVANETMLAEVRKEVDIMNLLKGHPNIVHFIDAAWHKMLNGVFEVFILMEYCAGGGIIDMMNRRLQERLTEAEILQIFVDVCEGVARMHNNRPPLLHRDLKVENILQSSTSSFKLCDFGSATTVARLPTNIQDIRTLEADLNRHTTLQYRPPEMVDLYSKRPINEKSDVWALGILLYKLCYYTTPFEEHGQLAILNVQYRTPPYPVYSDHMNSLIASMLRENGVQRPSVFEILAHVHRLRGTKSQFQYAIPASESLSLKFHPQPKLASRAVDSTVTYGSHHDSPRPVIHHQRLSLPAKSAGIQARDQVLEAINPMRRGRPTSAKGSDSSRSSSPYNVPFAPVRVITEIVQRFETIGSGASLSPVPSSPGMVVKPTPIREPLASLFMAADSRRVGQVSGESRKLGASLSVPDSIWSGDPEKGDRNGSVRPSPKSASERSPARTRRMLSMSGSKKVVDRESQDKEDEFPSMRPTNSLFKANTTIYQSVMPVRKAAEEEPASSNTVSRSSSPERSYQGVGRLIDHWQRKTVEAEEGRTPVVTKRGNMAFKKRTALVNAPVGSG